MFKITSFEYHVRSGVGIGGVWADKPIWVGVVEANGHQLGFSRFDNETQWCCDFHFGKNGFPVFCHGEGSRSCLKQVAKGELESELNKLKDNYSSKEPKKVYGVA